MTYIKKMAMQGFKSFAKKTEIYFDKGINTIVGPNGSGKSNVSDALCFALGRLSIKSMRAAKAKNLLFMGSKYAKPAKEAFVEIVFDNSEKTFNIPADEVVLRRVVKYNGQSTYKINGETKTRSDVVETLAQAGIDAHGFNLILQGQIQAVVKMHSEERRKILEEVSGIAIYESRKERSLKELEKTDQRLKEISAVLRERTAFLRNLEKERSQAMKYKELEETISRCKFTILSKKIKDKEREISSIQSSISEKQQQKESIRKKIESFQDKIEETNSEISKINSHIKRSTGVERESLQEKISDLRAEVEGLKVRIENNENRKGEIDRRIIQMQSSIPEYKREIEDLQKKSPLMAKKQEELRKKKQELSNLEEQKNKIFSSKSELNSIKDRIRNEESRLNKLHGESDSVLKQVEEVSQNLNYLKKESCESELQKLKLELSEFKSQIPELNQKLIEINKIISGAESQIASTKDVKKRVSELDICPLCKNKMTEEHVKSIDSESNTKIEEFQEIINSSQNKISELENKIEELESKSKKSTDRISVLEHELSTHRVILEKQNYLKKILDEIKLLENNIKELNSKRENLESKSQDYNTILENYNIKLQELEQISAITEDNLDISLRHKEAELEKMNFSINRNKKDLEELNEDLKEMSNSLKDKTKMLSSKEKEESEMNEKFKKLFDQRDELQTLLQESNYESSSLQTEVAQIDEQINYLKVGDARLSAEKESLEIERTEFPETELLQGSIEVLNEKLIKSRNTLQTLGSINMRALEVYDEVKDEYDKVYSKVETLESEKLEIMKIIEEIDNKKKRTFIKTFKGINELFKRNFSQLSTKGEAFLEIQNKEDIFAGGIDIVIRMAKGKYFDVTSLSGGEQTLIALSLLFAIQEHKPYHFYVFDEIDAALDKRNSERLSGLLRKYMQQGQYIVVTHNDAIITDSNFLYGVSMHDGVSKVLSLKVKDE